MGIPYRAEPVGARPPRGHVLRDARMVHILNLGNIYSIKKEVQKATSVPQILYLIVRSLPERARPKGMYYGMPEWVYLIARSLTERARPEGMYYGMPEWVYLIARSLTERAHA
ncbi:MAG: hypothetical protein ACLSFZ_07760 [Frisingicoccus sp.]